MTPRFVTAAALLALGAAGLATLVLLNSGRPDAQPEVAPVEDRASLTTAPATVTAPAPDAGARNPLTDRQPITDPVARLKKLYRINPRRSDVNGKFIGDLSGRAQRPAPSRQTSRSRADPKEDGPPTRLDPLPANRHSPSSSVTRNGSEGRSVRPA